MHDANIFVPGCSYEHAARPGAWPWPGMGSLKSDWLHSPLSHLQGAVQLLHHCSNVIPMVMMNFGFKESCQLLHACCTFYTIRPDPVICEQPPASRQLTADKLVTTPAPAQHSTACRLTTTQLSSDLLATGWGGRCSVLRHVVIR